MKASTAVFIYLLFGAFFIFVGISMIGISGTVEANYESHTTINPSFVLSVGGAVVIAVSLLFVWLTLRFFRTESVGE